jgi:hypothetical protein
MLRLPRVFSHREIRGMCDEGLDARLVAIKRQLQWQYEYVASPERYSLIAEKQEIEREISRRHLATMQQRQRRQA